MHENSRVFFFIRNLYLSISNLDVLLVPNLRYRFNFFLQTCVSRGVIFKT